MTQKDQVKSTDPLVLTSRVWYLVFEATNSHMLADIVAEEVLDHLRELGAGTAMENEADPDLF
jgi:hypothetical protein